MYLCTYRLATFLNHTPVVLIPNPLSHLHHLLTARECSLRYGHLYVCFDARLYCQLDIDCAIHLLLLRYVVQSIDGFLHPRLGKDFGFARGSRSQCMRRGLRRRRSSIQCSSCAKLQGRKDTQSTLLVRVSVAWTRLVGHIRARWAAGAHEMQAYLLLVEQHLQEAITFGRNCSEFLSHEIELI